MDDRGIEGLEDIERPANLMHVHLLPPSAHPFVATVRTATSLACHHHRGKRATRGYVTAIPVIHATAVTRRGPARRTLPISGDTGHHECACCALAGSSHYPNPLSGLITVQWPL